MAVRLLGNGSPDSNRFILVNPKSENDVRLQATLANQNPTGLPVGAVSEQPDDDDLTSKNALAEHFANLNAAPPTCRQFIDFVDYKNLTSSCWHDYNWNDSGITIAQYEVSVPAETALAIDPDDSISIEGIHITKYLEDAPINIAAQNSLVLETAKDSEDNSEPDSKNKLFYILNDYEFGDEIFNILPEFGSESPKYLPSLSITTLNNDVNNVSSTRESSWGGDDNDLDEDISVVLTPYSGNKYIGKTYSGSFEIMFSRG